MASKLNGGQPPNGNLRAELKNGVATPNTNDVQPDDEAEIEFDDAVKEAKELLTREVKDQLRLGELADKVKPQYGKNTLGAFAKAIGLAECTVKRRRSVYRAMKKLQPKLEVIGAAPPKLYAVAQALEPLADEHPEQAAAILKDHPNITTAKARELVKEKLATQGADQAKGKADATDDDKEHRSWCLLLTRNARDLRKKAAAPMDPEQLRVLAETQSALTDLQSCADELTKLVVAAKESLEDEAIDEPVAENNPVPEATDAPKTKRHRRASAPAELSQGA
jgi:hypothetical protein